jgi:hypothetical protein
VLRVQGRQEPRCPLRFAQGLEDVKIALLEPEATAKARDEAARKEKERRKTKKRQQRSGGGGIKPKSFLTFSARAATPRRPATRRMGAETAPTRRAPPRTEVVERRALR